MSIAQSCKIEGCRKLGKKASGTGKRYLPLGMCAAHYQRYKLGRDISVPSQREKRIAIIEGDVAKIPLGVGAKDGYAIVDSDIAKEVDKYKWHLDGRNGYPAGVVNKKKVRLHRFIIPTVEEGRVVDHINRNKLDNRASNLRIVDEATNLRNTMARSSTGVKGVYETQSGTYRSVISYGWQNIHIGTFKTIEEATKAYKNAIIELTGEV